MLGSPTATFEVVESTGNVSSEKAGVGGSTPSLATILINGLADQPEISHLVVAYSPDQTAFELLAVKFRIADHP